MTVSSPLSPWITVRESRCRLRPVTEAGAVENTSMPSIQIPQTGFAWGRPSERVVQTQ
jgi:hypothetical protein